MKKFITFLFVFLCLTGCKYSTMNSIETIIEHTGSTIVAINYPVTGIKKLDKLLNKNIKNTYKSFEEDFGVNESDEQAELNIDYTYHIVNKRYHVISITTFISSSKMAHPSNEITTYVYDQIQDKLLTLSDFIDEENLVILGKKIESILKKQYDMCLIETLSKNTNELYQLFSLFTIDSKNLTIYFNPYIVTSGNCGIIKIDIPLSEIHLLLEVTGDIYEENMVFKTQNTHSVLDPNQKVVALTFDDGPSHYTDEILDYLKQEGVNATFFVLGNKIPNYKDTLRKMIANGNEIGNHSYNHKLLTNLSSKEIEEQIQLTNDLVFNTTGVHPRLLRPTYGAVNKKIRNSTDMEIVLWTIDTLDWKIKDFKKIANNTIRDVKDLDIILMHDIRERTVDALKVIIPKLKEDGYQIVTVSELRAIERLREQIKTKN